VSTSIGASPSTTTPSASTNPSLSTGLPPGWVVRPATPDDADVAWEVTAAFDRSVVGRPDMTRDEVRDVIEEVRAEAKADTDVNALLVLDADSTARGFCYVFPKHGSDLVDIDLYADPAVDRHDGLDLSGWLLTQVERRAAEHGRAAGLASVRADKGCYRQDETSRQMLEARGYVMATTFNRMRVELEGPPDEQPPSPPPGYRVRHVDAGDEAGLRAAHAVREASFDQHFGSVARPYEEWYASLAARSEVDFSQLWLVETDEGEPVAMVLNTDAFVEDDNAGYVLSIGTVTQHRGRGLARLLLQISFADMRRRGRVAAILHVDTANVTDALRLYESVGMRPVLQVDIWRRTIETGVRGDAEA